MLVTECHNGLVNVLASTQLVDWELHPHTNCWTGHGSQALRTFHFDGETLAAVAAEVDEGAKKELFVSACKLGCICMANCTGFTFKPGNNGTKPACYLKAEINLPHCSVHKHEPIELYKWNFLSPPFPPVPPPSAPFDWEVHTHTNCWTGHGSQALRAFHFDGETLAAVAAEVDEGAKKELLVSACKLGCTGMCTGFTFKPGNNGTKSACYLKAEINLTHCGTNEFIELYRWHFLSPPFPPVPPPSPPIGNTIKFFAIGDWNFDHMWEDEPNRVPDWVGNSVLCRSTCQGHIASLMEREASVAPSEYKMVINAGDNFYPFGVDSEHSWQWEERWGKVYSGLPNMVWYSTQGNHDLSQRNRACACGRNTQGCSQIRKHMGKHQGHTWYMPDFNYWVKPFPGVPLEIVSLDTNHHDSGRICPWNVCDKKACAFNEKNEEDPNSCFMHECQRILEERTLAAEDLLRKRLDANIGGNVIVVTHYPINYFKWGGILGEHGSPGIIEQLQRSDVSITFFGAHIHLTEGEEQSPQS